LIEFLNIAKSYGKKILVTDYCSTSYNIDSSYSRNSHLGYISFAANHRELNNIPEYPKSLFCENNAKITSLSQVNNFLYLINPENYGSKAQFISDVTARNYDLMIMDLFFNGRITFNASEINQLKNKSNGGKRLVLAYLSIGEAEDYRYYWQTRWTNQKPDWLLDENPDWKGNLKVKFWNKEWQSIITGNDSSYLHMIMKADFDGVYLDRVDAFEYFE
jgi:cysteinyl-tRNA synthetase